MMLQPKPIVDVLIDTPTGMRRCRRFVFDLPTGHDRDSRGLFIKIGHAAIPITPRQVRSGRITVWSEKLVNVPVEAKELNLVVGPLRKAQ